MPLAGTGVAVARVVGDDLFLHVVAVGRDQSGERWPVAIIRRTQRMCMYASGTMAGISLVS